MVHIIPSGCCGMAGSFGYEHYQTSIAIGEMVLFPAIRQAVRGKSSVINDQWSAVSNQQSVTVIAAPGISCRTQIKDGTGITAHHPIEILYRLLRNE
jgi:Fe-S oxidoreductase